MSDESWAKYEAWVLRWGKLCVALTGIGVVLAFAGAVALSGLKSWVVTEANAQAMKVMKDDRDALNAADRKMAAAIDDMNGALYDVKKDVRAVSDQIRTATGVGSTRLSQPLPPPPSLLTLDAGAP